MTLILRTLLAVIGLIIFTPFLIFDNEISGALNFILSPNTLNLSNAADLVWTIGAVFILASMAPLFFCFEKHIRIWVLTITISLLMYVSPFFPETLLTTIQTYLGAAAIIAGGSIWAVKRKSKRDTH